MKKIIIFLLIGSFLSGQSYLNAADMSNKTQENEEDFSWWPTDAAPGPVKDSERPGYWWWPDKPGQIGPLWGNRGYIYVLKDLSQAKTVELPVEPKRLKPALLIKKIIKNVKIYFDYNKSELREDTLPILEEAVGLLNKDQESNILITGNCDIRGSEAYNEKLGRARAQSIKKFMLEKGVAEERIKIFSRGKLDAIAPVTDLEGMQKDRNAQFMIAEVEETMLPDKGLPPGIQGEAKILEEDKYLVEKSESVESAVKVSTREYTIKKGDTLWKIAAKELGSGYRWKYIYALNKERIKNPDRLKVGQKILIPVE